MLIMKDRLEEIGKLVINQDNRITDAPMFIVEKKVFDYGYDSQFCDEYKWIDYGEDHEEADEEETVRLDNLENTLEDTGTWEKVYYKERWQFVTACFTEKGCKDYIRLDGHNLGETRIYAEGSYRNNEFRDIRAALILYGQPDINPE